MNQTEQAMDQGNKTVQSLIDLIPPAMRSLYVAGLQALWRERVAAFNLARELADRQGRNPPDRSAFGIAEIDRALRDAGAGPIKF